MQVAKLSYKSYLYCHAHPRDSSAEPGTLEKGGLPQTSLASLVRDLSENAGVVLEVSLHSFLENGR